MDDERTTDLCYTITPYIILCSKDSNFSNFPERKKWSVQFNNKKGSEDEILNDVGP